MSVCLFVSQSVSTESAFGSIYNDSGLHAGSTPDKTTEHLYIQYRVGIRGFDEHGAYAEQLPPLAALPEIHHFVREL